MKKVLIISILILVNHFVSATIKYVKPSSSGTGDGSSWANASGDLRATLSAATSGDTVWVAGGTYKPTTGTDRALSFQVPSGVKVFGGFSGDESAGFNLFQRDLEANASILSGEIGGAGITDNTHHVVSTINVSDQTIVDGFTITKGYGIGGSEFGNGGGWLNKGTSKPQVRNIIFKLNTGSSGGALYNNGFNGDASPDISNCVFIDNYATNNGGAVYNRGSSGFATTLFSNCTFYRNDADNLGGAIYNFNVSFISIRNSILWDNKQLVATSTPVLNDYYNDGSSPSSTTVVNYSVISESGCPQNGGATNCNSVNSGNPNFLNAANNDLRLTANSTLALNNGLNSSVVTKNDLSNNLRIRNDVVDRGAYEYAETSTKIYVDQSSTVTTQTGRDWEEGFNDLQDALILSLAGDSIWVAKGTYKPTTTTDRTISFQIPDSVKVYGGFAGNEVAAYDVSLRDFTANETILSGNIGSTTDSLDNSYHVVYTKNVSSETYIDGFSIKGGSANGGNNLNLGGGWYNDGSGLGNTSNPKLSNIYFRKNAAASQGGAMINISLNGTANPSLSNCFFIDNTAGAGGAFNNQGSDGGKAFPTFINCTFAQNNANNSGGAVSNAGTQNGKAFSTFENCTFTQNGAVNNGGAIFSLALDGLASSFLENCIFSLNTANNGGAISNTGNFDSTIDQFISFCTFTQNTAIDDGGAIVNASFGPSTVNVELINSIFWNNSPSSLYNDGATSLFSWSIVQETNCADFANSASITCSSGVLFNQNPQFVDAENGIFNLKCSSPAINMGIQTLGTSTNDLTGFARTGIPDMGAYEYGYAILNETIKDGVNPNLSGVPTITAQSPIENTNTVLLNGINHVEMLPGFQVAPINGAATVFTAEIDNNQCP